MIEYILDKTSATLHIRPTSALKQGDFEELAQAVDPFIAEAGGLAGLIVEIHSFPGWESFGAMVAHYRFVRDHRKQIRKLAIVTDSALGDVAERLATHFVSAEIRHFPASELHAAHLWIAQDYRPSL